MQRIRAHMRSILAMLMAVSLLVGSCFGATAAGISKADSSSQTASGAISWRLAPTKYETEDTVVMGCLITDFISADQILAGADCTSAAQRAIDLLYEAGGGTLFFPEGQYTFRGTLVVKKGVTLCGDWQNPVENPAIRGTVFKVYSGRGNENGTAFIIMQPNTCVRNMSFWYPEQDASNIVAYPPTICTSDSTVWGADYMHVKNVTLVNSYIGIISATVSGGQMPCCPTLRYIYGSPLKLGVDMDGIVDVGRFDYIYFSPDYWVNSGLAGAPAANNNTYRNYIYNNGIGVALGRIDWSYLTYAHITGYNQGLRFRESTIDPGSAPNGQCYALTLKNCKYGIYAASMSSCGEAVTSVNISGCEYGLYIQRDSNNAEGLLQMMDINITASNYAVYHDGYINLIMTNASLNGGRTHLNNGVTTFTGCAFNTTGTQISMGNECMNAIISGCTFNGGMGISGAVDGKVAIDNEAAEVPAIADIPDFEYDYSRKPAREYLYVVNADNSGNSDVTGVIQSALNEAGRDGGGVVFLAPGHYRLNGTLTVPSGVEIKGAVDIGRNPIQLGTIFEVYGTAGGANGTATVTLSANSGIRGIVFNQPQQNYRNLTPYPYCVRGAGADVYVINVSLRNVYNGVDLMTNRCDNHYVEFLAGIALNNDLKVGGGSTGGVICNMQVNYGCLNNGSESKNGSWPNSPSEPVGQAVVQERLNGYAEVFTIGDTEQQMCFNNFSYSGRYGIHLVSENGTGGNGLPDGWILGQGVDSGISAFCIDAIGTMPFVNAQIVALSKDYVSTEYTNHIVMGAGAGTVDMYNVACWGHAKGFVRADGGTLNLYNSNFFNFVDYFGYVQSGAKVNLVNSMFHSNGNQKLFSANQNNVAMANVFYTNSIADLDDYVNADRIYKRNSSWVEKLGVRVQAEGYDTMVGMEVEGCEDGGQELGFVDNGDYATYTVNVPAAGRYTLRVRGASPDGGSVIQLRNAAGTTLGSATIGKTGGWQVWDCFTSGAFDLPAGEQTLTLYIAQGGCNLNWFELVGASGSAAVTTVGTGTTRVEAENFVEMSGVQTEGCGDNGGGQDVGYTNSGDWLDYKLNVTTSGTYRLRLRAASPYDNGSIAVKALGITKATCGVKNTGDWQVYANNESDTFTLLAGEQTLRIYMVGSDFNLNWFELIYVGAAGNVGSTYAGEPVKGPSTNAVSGGSTPTPNPPSSDPVAGEGAKYMATSVGSDASINGQGYVENLHNPGAYCDFAGVDGGSGGNATVTLYYAMEGSDAASVAVSVNGAAATTLSLNATQGWSDYSGTATFTVSLNSGASNTIRFTGGNGGFNAAFITVVPTTGGSTGGSNTVTTVGTSTVRIQAENYNDMYGIQAEASSDEDGSENIGFMENGDWLDYRVNVQQAGTYKLALRAASPDGGAVMQLRSGNTTLAEIAIAKTGDWQAYQTFESGEFTLAAGEQTLRLYVQAAGENINWFELTYVPSTGGNNGGSTGGSNTVTTIGTSTVRIQAENYNAMYGIETEGCGDEGGTDDVGYTNGGDWLDYRINVQRAGTYKLQLRLASPYDTGLIYVQQNDISLTQCKLAATGDWQSYKTFDAGTLELSAGEQTLRLYVQNGDWNINWLELTYDQNASKKAGNPVITTLFTADPSAHVWEKDGKIYLYASQDVFPSQGCDLMDKYHIFSSDNMVDWHDEGEILRSENLNWGISGFMWAPDCAYKDGTYYFYYPHPSASPWNDNWKIGVATSNQPAANFVDRGYIQDLAGYSLIDPCVFRDDDGTYYIYIGGGATCMGGKLADDMMSIDGEMTRMTGLGDFHEGAWVFKRGDIYYLMYADNTAGENQMRYATSSNPLGPWTEQGVMLEGTGCDTTHGSVVEYKGNWYLFYHNAAISGNGTLRSVCIDRLYFNADGTIRMVKQTAEGVSALGAVKGDNTGTSAESLSQYTVHTDYGLNSCTVGGGATKGNVVENLHVSGAYAEFRGINGGLGGKALLTVKYATPDGASAKVDTTGDTAGNGYYLGMKATSGWSDASGVATCLVDLVPGTNNVIRLTGGMGGFNLVSITVSRLPGEVTTTTTTTTTRPTTTTTTQATTAPTQVQGNETTYKASSASVAAVDGNGGVHDLHLADSYCDYIVQGNGTEATVKLVYAHGDAGATAGVQVNGVTQADLNLATTGGWENYTGVATFTVKLNRGANTIRFFGGRNGYNIAYITVTTQQATETTYKASSANVAAINGNGGVQDLHLENSYCDYIVQGTGSAATIKLVYAHADGGATAGVQVNGVTQADLNLATTGGWENYTGEATFTVTLKSGANTIRFLGGRNGYNIAYIVVTTTGAAAPTAIRVEAENYTAMYGIETEGCSDEGGTQDVGYTDNGDWLDYRVNVTAAGTYKLALRASSPYGGGQIALQRSGATLAQVTVNSTGDWQAYQTFESGTFTLSAGEQTLRLYVQNAGVNLNWFELIPA